MDTFLNTVIVTCVVLIPVCLVLLVREVVLLTEERCPPRPYDQDQETD